VAAAPAHEQIASVGRGGRVDRVGRQQRFGGGYAHAAGRVAGRGGDRRPDRCTGRRRRRPALPGRGGQVSGRRREQRFPIADAATTLAPAARPAELRRVRVVRRDKRDDGRRRRRRRWRRSRPRRRRRRTDGRRRRFQFVFVQRQQQRQQQQRRRRWRRRRRRRRRRCGKDVVGGGGGGRSDGQSPSRYLVPSAIRDRPTSVLWSYHASGRRETNGGRSESSPPEPPEPTPPAQQQQQ